MRDFKELVPSAFGVDLGEKPRPHCFLLVVRKLMRLFDSAIKQLAHIASDFTRLLYPIGGKGVIRRMP